MKRISIILLGLISLAQAQTPAPGYTDINSRYQWYAGRFKALATPAGTDTASAFITGQWRIAGTIFTDTSGTGKGAYMWYDNKWNAIKADAGLAGNNLGLGYRLYSPPGQGVYTLFNGQGILWDSTSNANGLTPKLDTTFARTVANSYNKAQTDALLAGITLQKVLTAGSLLTDPSASITNDPSNLSGGLTVTMGNGAAVKSVLSLQPNVLTNLVSAGSTPLAGNIAVGTPANIFGFTSRNNQSYNWTLLGGSKYQYMGTDSNTNRSVADSFIHTGHTARMESITTIGIPGVAVANSNKYAFRLSRNTGTRNDGKYQYVIFFEDTAYASAGQLGLKAGVQHGTYNNTGQGWFTNNGSLTMTLNLNGGLQIGTLAGNTNPGRPSAGGLQVTGQIEAFDSLTLKNNKNVSASTADSVLVAGANGVIKTSVPLSSLSGGGGGMINPMTTAGDIIYGGASGTPTRLAAGTNTYVLTMTGGNPVWAAPASGGVSQATITDTLQNYWRVTGNAISSGKIGTTNAQGLDIIANNVSRINFPSSTTGDITFGNGTYPAVPSSYIFRYYNATAASRGLVLDDIGNGLGVRLSAHSGSKLLVQTKAGAVSGIEFGSMVNPNDGSLLNAGASGLWSLSGSSKFGIGQTSPTARLHIAAGTATAGTAPLLFTQTSAALLTTPVAGAMEVLTDKLYYTINTGAARKEVTLNDAALTPGTTPVATTNGRLTDGLILASGNYTPTITNSTNISSSTLGSARYVRVGNIVDVTVTLTVTATASATNTVFRLSLPIASNLAANADLSGYGSEDRGNGSAVQGLSLTDDAQMSYTSTTTSPIVVILTFKYTIL
jgi:hypothetical protein